MTNRIYTVCSILVLFAVLQSCVSAKKYDEQSAMTERYKVQKDLCKSDLAEERLINKKLTFENEKLNRYYKSLVNDTLKMKAQLLTYAREINSLNDQLDQSILQNQALASNSAKELRLLNEQLSEKESELKLHQDELDALDFSLNEKASQISNLSKDLEERERKLKELESLLSNKENAIAALKTSITEALTGFSAEDLSINVKEGRIYVSLSEHLLFKSGSADVDPKGADALAKLSKVLQGESDIQVIVEGHTDNVPYFSNGGDIEDNWDLSVMRATSVVKILTNLDTGMDPYRVIASGRSEYFPVDNNESADGRSKNRRTEIILAPDIQAVFDILENN